MLSEVLFTAALLASSAIAGPCRPRDNSTAPGTIVPTLPSTGAADLPAPAENMTLKAVALGHGLQNYSCADTTGDAKANGALAALYDVTALFPGSPQGLSQEDWDDLTTKVLFSQTLPLNLIDDSFADPGSEEDPNAGPESAYQGDKEQPFLPDANLEVDGVSPRPMIGRHFFSASSDPTFDLSEIGLLGVVGKAGNVKAPADASKGLLDTSAVDWLFLTNKGASQGVAAVYRVNTAGGAAQPCSVSGAGDLGVPYAALYYFYQ